MAGFNGSGTYVRNFSWVNDKTNGINITASRFDTEDNGFATGLSTVICKDGQTTTTSKIPFAAGVAAGTGSTAAVAYGFIGSVNTGLYQAATNQVNVAAGGSLAGTFTTTGLNATPIGATTPSTGNFTTLTATTISGPISANAVGKVAITQPATGSTLTILDGKTAKFDNTIEFAGTDSTVMTFPSASGAVITATSTASLTNKTFNTASTGNVFQVNGISITGVTGTGSTVALSVAPAFTGIPTAPTASANTGGTQIATCGYADTAAAGAGLSLLATITAASSTTVAFTSNIDNTFNKHVIEFDNVVLGSIDGINFEVSTNGGGTWMAGTSFAGSMLAQGLAGTTASGFTIQDNGTPGNFKIYPQSFGNATATAGQGISGTIRFQTKPATSQWQSFIYEIIDPNAGVIRGGFAVQAAVTINAVQFITANTGGGHNFATGNFHLYGIKGS